MKISEKHFGLVVGP